MPADRRGHPAARWRRGARRSEAGSRAETQRDAETEREGPKAPERRNRGQAGQLLYGVLFRSGPGHEWPRSRAIDAESEGTPNERERERGEAWDRTPGSRRQRRYGNDDALPTIADGLQGGWVGTVNLHETALIDDT